MKKEVIVISLGGSLIIPKTPDYTFLNKFKETLKQNFKTHKFVLVCGGGSVARNYIETLKKSGNTNKKALSLAGIRATRMNAKLVMQLFGEKYANDSLPLSMKSVKSNLSKNSVVICGALRYDPDSTSDGTASKLAKYLESKFINLTDVLGLYTSDPKKDKNAKLIKEITWEEFDEIINKIKFNAGQHFVLDHKAAKIIKKNKITTYILGKDLKNLNNFLNNKKFIGTTISN